MLLRNEGGNQNHWLRLALKGLDDNKPPSGPRSKFLPAPTGKNLKSRIVRIPRTEFHGRSSSASAIPKKQTLSACCGPPESCKMKLQSPAISSRTFKRSTGAGVRVHFICMEWRALRVRRRHAGCGRRGALDWTGTAQCSAPVGVDQAQSVFSSGEGNARLTHSLSS